MPKERRDNSVLEAVMAVSKQASNLEVKLAENTNETKNIVSHLSQLNGSVAKHEAAIGAAVQNLALLTQTVQLQQDMLKESKSSRNTWLDWLLKGIVGIALLLLYSLLTNAGIVKDFLPHAIK